MSQARDNTRHGRVRDSRSECSHRWSVFFWAVSSQADTTERRRGFVAAPTTGHRNTPAPSRAPRVPCPHPARQYCAYRAFYCVPSRDHQAPTYGCRQCVVNKVMARPGLARHLAHASTECGAAGGSLYGAARPPHREACRLPSGPRPPGSITYLSTSLPPPSTACGGKGYSFRKRCSEIPRTATPR
jgi:hypothetical protein